MKIFVRNLFFLFFPLLGGVIVSLLIKNSIDYTSLVKPPLAPPSFFFPLVWTIIYLLMGISYFLYKKDTNSNNLIDVLYYGQLFVNFFWSFIFFLWKTRLLAVWWIILLDVLVFFLIYLFWQKKKISAYLNVFYLLWILFATYLTVGIYILN